MSEPIKVVVYQCPTHPNLFRMTFEFESGTGVRVLGMKCCVNQYGREICRWTPSKGDLERMIDEAEGAIPDAEPKHA